MAASVKGPRGSGKSMFARMLVNRLLLRYWSYFILRNRVNHHGVDISMLLTLTVTQDKQNLPHPVLCLSTYLQSRYTVSLGKLAQPNLAKTHTQVLHSPTPVNRSGLTLLALQRYSRPPGTIKIAYWLYSMHIVLMSGTATNSTMNQNPQTKPLVLMTSRGYP